MYPTHTSIAFAITALLGAACASGEGSDTSSSTSASSGQGTGASTASSAGGSPTASSGVTGGTGGTTAAGGTGNGGNGGAGMAAAGGSGGSGGSPPPPPCWALDFSKPADIVTAPASVKLDYGDAYTVEAWANWRGQGNIEWQYLAMQGWAAVDGDFVFRVQIKNGTIYFTTYDQYGPNGQANQSTSITGLENSWMHVAGVYAAGSAALYLNGQLVATGKASKPSSTSTKANIHLGGYNGGYPFDGIIDEVRISKSARYQANFVPPMFHANDANTLALWRLDEGSGNTTVDATGNGHDGIIAGAAWTGESACKNGGTP